MGIKFEFLKAYNGDCILISTKNSKVLIDGGTKKTYSKFLKTKIEALRENNQKLDLVILTHIDSDHISGIIKLLENEKMLLEDKSISSSIIKRVWFNAFEGKMFSNDFSHETSYQEYKSFREFIHDMNDFIEYDEHISVNNQINYNLNSEINFTLLSPNDTKLKKIHKQHKDEIEKDFYTSSNRTRDMSIENLVQLPFKKDTSPSNGGSIAFILEYDDKKYLFLGDAHIDLIVESLQKEGYTKENPLKIEFVKLSHHGSKKNINQDFLDLIRSNNFIILTNGASHGHPDKEALSRIILNPNRDFSKQINFICNYEEILNEGKFLYEDEEKYNFELIYRREF